MKSELIIGNLRQINSSKALVLLLEFIKKYGINYFSNFVYDYHKSNDEQILEGKNDSSKIIVSLEIWNKYTEAVEFLKKWGSSFFINLINDPDNKLFEYLKNNITEIDLLIENAKRIERLKVNRICYIPNFTSDIFKSSIELGIMDLFYYQNPYCKEGNRHLYITRTKPYTDGIMDCELVRDSKGYEEWFDVKFKNHNWILVSRISDWSANDNPDSYCGFKQIKARDMESSLNYDAHFYSNTFIFDATKLPDEEELCSLETPQVMKLARKRYYKDQDGTPIESI